MEMWQVETEESHLLLIFPIIFFPFFQAILFTSSYDIIQIFF